MFPLALGGEIVAPTIGMGDPDKNDGLRIGTTQDVSASAGIGSLRVKDPAEVHFKSCSGQSC